MPLFTTAGGTGEGAFRKGVVSVFRLQDSREGLPELPEPEGLF